MLLPDFACPTELRDPETGESASVIYVDVELTGENGQRQMNDDRKLEVPGRGRPAVGFGSANPRTEQRYPEGSLPPTMGKRLQQCLWRKAERPR